MSEPEKLSLRRLLEDDFSLLIDWINTPHVAPWWDGPADMHYVIERYGSRRAKYRHTHVYIAELKHKPIGFIQFYRHSDYPDWDKIVGIEDAIGIDYLIGESNFIGKGLGTQMIKQTTKIAFDKYTESKVVISTPKKANYASCRVLEKAGFKLFEERFLKSNNPGDAGVSAIYGLYRHC